MYLRGVLGSASIRNFSCDQLYPKNNLLLTALIVSGVVGVLIGGIGAGHFFAQSNMLHGWLANFNFLGNVNQGLAIGLTAGGGFLMALGLHGLIGMVKKTCAESAQRAQHERAKIDRARLTDQYFQEQTAKSKMEKELAICKAKFKNRDGEKEKVKEQPKGELEVLQGAYASLLDQLAEKNKDLARLREAATSAEEQLRQLQEKSGFTEKECAEKDAEIEETKAKLLGIMKKMQEIQEASEALVVENRATKEKLAEKERLLVGSREELAEMAERLKNCEQEMQALTEQFTSFFSEGDAED